MRFPETNKMHREPIPARIESNAKVLEEHLKRVNWKVFGRAYLYVLAYVCLTVFSLVVATGLAKKFVDLF